MGVRLHWFLPTNGDSRTNPSFGSAIGARDGRGQAGATERKGDLAYMSQVARAAEAMGFEAGADPDQLLVR
jgi:alkanesulfonate monooxygenase